MSCRGGSRTPILALKLDNISSVRRGEPRGCIGSAQCPYSRGSLAVWDDRVIHAVIVPSHGPHRSVAKP
jgi:hypothetical protein